MYLPAGHTWVFLHDGTAFEGGQTVLVRAPLAVIPVFLKDGSHSELIGLI